jgi:hypothetical protein
MKPFMEVTYSKAAARALMHMPANTAQRIRAKIEQHAADPASLANNVKRLRGGNAIGSWSSGKTVWFLRSSALPHGARPTAEVTK